MQRVAEHSARVVDCFDGIFSSRYQIEDSSRVLLCKGSGVAMVWDLTEWPIIFDSFASYSPVAGVEVSALRRTFFTYVLESG